MLAVSNSTVRGDSSASSNSFSDPPASMLRASRRTRRWMVRLRSMLSAAASSMARRASTSLARSGFSLVTL